MPEGHKGPKGAHGGQERGQEQHRSLPPPSQQQQQRQQHVQKPEYNLPVIITNPVYSTIKSTVQNFFFKGSNAK